MGVISFGDDAAVWGSSAGFLRGLVEKAIDTFGEHDYLRHFRFTMDWAYNHLDMEELNVDELKEFLAVLPIYKASYLALSGLVDAAAHGAEHLLDDLTAKLGAYIDERQAQGRLTVERDLWTLRMADDAERRLHAPLVVIEDGPGYIAALQSLIGPGLAVYQGVGTEPMEDALARFGAHLGADFDRLNDPEAVFLLIEDGMNPATDEGDEIANAINLHLIGAMVAASAKAGTWERLQRPLGGETRKFALELYEFDYVQPDVSTLSPHELKRLEQLLQAARDRDWQRFRQLSDEPYANEDAMHEQFDMSAALLQTIGACKITFAAAVKHKGVRIIHAKIGHRVGGKEITATLHSLSSRDDSLISVWTFHPSQSFD